MKIEKEIIYELLNDKYGIKQLYVAIEELSELQKEICKAIRKDEPTNQKEIKEEIADVSIMLEQIIYYFNFDDDEIKKNQRSKIK